MNTRTLALGLCLLAPAAAVAGCGSGGSNITTGQSSSASSSASPAATADHRGGTLTMLWNGAGASIDTAIDYDRNWQILRMTNDGLLAWRQVSGPKGNELVPDLATAIPTPTDGGKTYVFTLRKGVRFSNGKEVKPSDVTYTLERDFKAAGPGAGFYAGIVGGAACAKTPKTCDLSKGVIADDAAGTVTIKLTEPDGDILEKFASPFSYVVPTGTKNKDVGTKPLPATGPYMIDSYQPDSQMTFVRNPNFKQWSAEAQPSGNPDKIVMKIGLSLEDATTQVEKGQADWMYENPPADRLGEVSTKDAKRLHVNSIPQVFYEALNTRVAPFDNVKARQALNFAVDRNALVKIFGGPALAKTTCQILPPEFPGYQPYCPYTASPGEKWSAPDMAKAKQLVAESGTKGQKVTVVSTTEDTGKAISLYIVSVLRDLGYNAKIKTLSESVEYSYVQDSRNKAQLSYTYWLPDYPAASNFLNSAVGCAGFTKASTSSPNLSEFCDPKIDAMTKQALKQQQTDPQGANQAWAQIDKAVTDAAPWVSLYVANRVDLLSERVGGYEFNPSVAGGFMIQKAWVK